MTSADFRISWAGRIDLPSIERINRHFDGPQSHDPGFFQEGLTSGRLLLAKSNEIPGGYLLYQLLWGNLPFIALLRVIPDLRGKGLGSRLWRIAGERLRNEGYAAVLSSCEETNQRGNEFHVKMGFKKIGMLSLCFANEIFYTVNL